MRCDFDEYVVNEMDFTLPLDSVSALNRCLIVVKSGLVNGNRYGRLDI